MTVKLVSALRTLAFTFFCLLTQANASAEPLTELRIDWATYNPLSLIVKNGQYLEKEFAADGITVRWVQSTGSNKTLEYMNAGSVDIGSVAGSAALIARANGNPVKLVYVYSRPEWTALVVPAGSPAKGPADLKGKRIAAARGTDAYVFMLRALQSSGLSEKDVSIVLLQHADGKSALLRGDVDAWAGLDPMMAAAELESGARLIYRDAAANTWGLLAVREEFLTSHLQIAKRVVAAYERAREAARNDPSLVLKALVSATKLPENVIARQIERTDLGPYAIGDVQRDAILKAGQALQAAGHIDPNADLNSLASELIDQRLQH